jgi:hypothetical protein
LKNRTLVGAMQYIYYTIFAESGGKVQGAKGAFGKCSG